MVETREGGATQGNLKKFSFKISQNFEFKKFKVQILNFI